MLHTKRGILSGPEYYAIRSINNGKYRLVVNLSPDIEYRCLVEWPGWEQAALTDPFAAQLVDRHKHRPAYLRRRSASYGGTSRRDGL